MKIYIESDEQYPYFRLIEDAKDQGHHVRPDGRLRWPQASTPPSTR